MLPTDDLYSVDMFCDMYHSAPVGLNKGLLPRSERNLCRKFLWQHACCIFMFTRSQQKLTLGVLSRAAALLAVKLLRHHCVSREKRGVTLLPLQHVSHTNSKQFYLTKVGAVLPLVLG